MSELYRPHITEHNVYDILCSSICDSYRTQNRLLVIINVASDMENLLLIRYIRQGKSLKIR
jgi:hypothetical protein